MIWDSHPYPDFPCDATLFQNQCAIRMGVALNGAGLSTAPFLGAKCYPNLKHSPKHTLRAQELANWLVTQTAAVGTVQKYKTKMTSAEFWGKTGIVFIQDGWGATDHIDIWDGTALKGGSPEYFARGKQVWFWALP
jgi:hypothetical protein